MSNRPAGRERVDRLLLSQGLADSRHQAQALLMAGRVYVGERRIDKAGTLLPVETPLSIKQGARYVSRGGLKLEGALKALQLSVRGLAAADIGASTGGFTDCLLQNGARKIFAVDVGHGQLAPSLRDNPRVVVMERTNARYLQPGSLGELVELVVVDASFISLEKLLKGIAGVLQRPGLLLALVKPQFEVGRSEASRNKGVIRDEALRTQAIQQTLQTIASHGFEVLADCSCEIRGPKGNQEHFVLARIS